MNVALINPPSPFLINERVFPNIGLVRVATALRGEGYDVDLHDFSGRNPSEIRQIANNYELFGFSSTTPQMQSTVGLLDLLKQENPTARTIIGGPHASAMYHLKQKGIQDLNIKDLERFDTVFAGEGENVDKMFRLGWQNGGIVNDIDTTLIPDRSFLTGKPYKYEMDGQPTTSIQTQRGCPFVCEFCCGRDVEMYKKVRQHSPERVLKELDQLHDEHGYSSFMWYDDEVNSNSGRLEALCDALSSRPYQHRGFVRSDQIVKHPESVQQLKKAGFVKLCTGVESGSDRILKLIRKGVTVEQNYEARRLIGAAGIHYEAFTMVGHPSETPEDVAMTDKWLRTAKPDDFDINVLTVYPGCKIYDGAAPSTKHEGYAFEYNGLFFNKPLYSRDPSFYKGLKGRSASSTRTDSMTETDIHEAREVIQKLK